ncbi:hypothetical protein [Pedobacter agri]|uniref:hypothetical protein n=1 Tax=Pedobacter agri TaxID=454586 RepID=UPI00292CCAA3|nr:hypothetical protein [Pedobacter agri]
MSNSKAIRKFERLLFRGIPEQPEHTYERDQNSIVTSRLTGKSQNENRIRRSQKTNVIGYVTYDFEAQTEKYTANDKYVKLVK